MLIATAVAALLMFAADAPAADAAGAASPTVSDAPKTVTKRVCEKVKSSSSRTPARVCKTITVPVQDAEAPKAGDPAAGAP